MIDQIQKTLAKIDPHATKDSKESPKSKDVDVTRAVSSPADAIDSADISMLAKSDNVAGLASSAPIDMDQVNEIKNAIANGDYPIDADRIADALMDVYREMITL